MADFGDSLQKGEEQVKSSARGLGAPKGIRIPVIALLLNKLSVSEVAELSSLSKSYISQVKSGKRPPSDELLQALEHSEFNEKAQDSRIAIALFLNSRPEGTSQGTLSQYYSLQGYTYPGELLSPKP